ncbi:MAG: DPP IV N-terminal domain-containing protein [Woeseiaceae bacterium]
MNDYKRAEEFLSVNVNHLVTDLIKKRYWGENDQFVYQKVTADDLVTVVADPRNGNKSFKASFKEPNTKNNKEHLSPDGTKAAFIVDYNLWVRDTRNNNITQLTFDGTEHYGYATNNAGWVRDDRPVLLWSPDSKKIATFRHDSRNVGEMYLVSTKVGHPELDAWKYPLPGDDSIFMIERIILHLDDEPRMVKLNMPPDPHRSSTGDHVADRQGRFIDVEWSAQSDLLAFVSSSRDHKSAKLRLADPETGEIRDIYNETVATYYESGFINPNWRILHHRNEFIWYSEKDNWAHLYLHDLQTGKIKKQLTSGDWSVLDLQRVDESNGLIFFTAANKENGDPYFHYLYSLNLDIGEPKLLTPEAANHSIEWSTSGEYLVDTFSTPNIVPTSVIRDKAGKIVMSLEKADASALIKKGWVAPEAFVVKARDNLTDLYGLLYKPSNFNPEYSYPILNYIYPGPQAGSVGSRSFRAARRDKQAIAELGFIVVEVDAMGTPGRSKSFHDAYYGNMGDNGLPDQITAIKQLAVERPWMDLQRIGVWGHSGGGYASTGAILRYPDFYKVAVSSAGNHDNRNYEDDWGEKWQGLLEESSITDANGNEILTTNYDNQANQLLAKNLEGKLLLAHGMMDDNVPPSNTLLMVQALIEAEKDFDLVIFPEAKHGFGNSRYFMKKRWNYFVKHLHNIEPPEDFHFKDNVK